MTTRNLGVSTHTENSELVIDKVVIFDVDRSFGSAVYGENNKYGIETRSLWSSNAEAFAITSDEIDNPSKETRKGMYYGPAQAPTFVADKNKWTEVDRLAFKKISTDPNGRFCQDFNYTLFKAAFIFEPVLASIVRGTVRNEGLLLDIPVCLTSSMQSAQIAISESKNWEQSFLRNYGSWKQQAIDEICASKEYKTAWDMARRSNLGLPENPRDYVIKQFENMFLAITNFNSCLLKIKDSLEDLKTQIKEMPISNEHKELLVNVLNMASLSADTSEHLTRRELFAHYKYIDTARDLIKNSEKSEESQNSLSLDRFNDNNLTSRLNVISATIAIINDAATKHNSPLSLKICCLCRNIYNLLKRLLKIKSQTKKATYSDISKQLEENLAKGYTASATLTPSPTRLGATTT